MSLYPYINKYTTYPIGHPESLVGSQARKAELSSSFDMVKAKVLPPRHLYLSVLPYRHNNKLYFPLCRTCTELPSNEESQHDEEDRYLSRTWVTTELEEAIAHGYAIVEVYEHWEFIWHWEERSLFSDYVNTFLKVKMEASG